MISKINSNVRLFADDTSIYVIVDNPQSSSDLLNTDLSNIHKWASTWLVDFNPSKTESLTISRKHNKPVHPDLFMNNVMVKNVPDHKHLGVIFSHTGKWHSHIASIVKRAWQRIGILRSLKFHLNRSCLERLYISFIRPLLEYSDVLWDNCTAEQSNDIESIQIEAARIVTGATKLCNIAKLYHDLKWDTLSNRRRKHKLILFYKMKQNISPSYLTNLIPIPQENRYPLRNRNDIPTIQSRTSLYQESFLPSVIRQWNSLPEDVKSSPTLSIFKHRISLNMQKPPVYYSAGSRLGQILHSRLRLECSSLNYDLHRKSIVEHPYCACGEIETSKHFLLSCPSHNVLRQALFSNLPCPLTYNNLILGSENLTVESNTYLFLQVQRYIIASKRFSA